MQYLAPTCFRLQEIILWVLVGFALNACSPSPAPPTPTVATLPDWQATRDAFAAQPPDDAIRAGDYLVGIDPTYGNSVVGLWDAETGAFVRWVYQGWQSVTPEQTRLSDDGRLLVITHDMGVLLWNVPEQRQLYRKDVGLDGWIATVFSRDMHYAALYGCGSSWEHGSCGDSFLVVLDLETGEPLYETDSPVPRVIDEAAFRDGGLWMQGCFGQWSHARCQGDGEVWLDFETGETVRLEATDEP